MSASPSATDRLRVAVAGASGRMGRMLIEAIQASGDCVLAGALDVPGSPALGQDATAFLGQTSGVAITSDLAAGLGDARFLIDFTRPEGTLAHLRHCREHGVKLVIGTTGFTDAQKAEITAAAADIAIVMAPNMSVGVNVVLKLLQQAGITPAVVTGRDSPALRLRLKALGVMHARFGTEDKRPAAESILAELGLSWPQAAAIGDDWPDLPVMRRVAFACAPAQAHIEARAVAHHVTAAPGGAGAAREFCDLLLVASGRYAGLLAAHAA